MNKLLIANFVRIKKNKLFWFLCGIVAFLSLIMVVNAISDTNKQINNIMCFFVIPAEIAVAVFISIFFGTEYGDGTIRNKLIVHDRKQIYLANLITAFTCAIVLIVSYMLPVILIGFPCIGLPDLLTVEIMASGFIALFSFCSLFTMVSMIYPNKAGATVINLVLAFLLLLVAVLCCTYLAQPEFIPAYGMDNGVEYLHNPNYVSGIKRTFLQILTDLLPSGQAVQFTLGVSSPLWALPIYSIGVCAVCTAVGMTVFNKKDIK